MYEENKGMEGTEKATEQLKKDIEEGKAISYELAKIWEKIRADAFFECPKDTGSLAQTIRVVKTSINSMESGISPIKSITIFNRAIVAGDLMKINPKTKGPVDYAGFVHDGYIKSGNVHNGRPFLTNALARNDEELNKAVDRALIKLGKKFEGGA
jgi:hypothetical protein